VINITETNSSGCSLTAQSNITIGPKPIPVINGRPRTCLNEGIQRYAASAIPNTDFRWSISGGGVIVSGINSDTVSVRWNQPGAYQITLYAVNRLTGCDSTVMMNINTDTITRPVISANLNGCSPVTVYVYGNNEAPTYTYQWRFGDGTTASSANPTHVYTAPGNYTIRVSVQSSFGCRDSTSNIVTVHPDPVADFLINGERDFFLAGMDVLQLSNTSHGSNNYEWSFGNGENSDDFEPEVMYDAAGIYMIQLITTNNFGCKDTTSHPLEIRVPEDIFIPNAFTPNGDAVNDYFSMTFLNIKEANVSIYNRWGEKIYSTKDLTFQWDGAVKGRSVQSDVYVYLVEAEGIYGTTIQRTGKITIVH
jgi:gliding motility-associated-like protein